MEVFDNATSEQKSLFQAKEASDRILTVEEVAGILRIHRATVSRLAKSGELKSHKIGNRRLFRESDVWTFFDNNICA